MQASIENAGRAVEAVVPKVTALLRSVRRPHLHAVGDWNVVEVAAHISHVFRADVMASGGSFPDVGPKLAQVTPEFFRHVAEMNAGFLRDDPERDPGALATRIEDGTADFLRLLESQSPDQLVVWLGGVKLPLWCMGAHLVSESLIHGFDIAAAEGLPWPIDRAHAAFAASFGFAFLDALDPDSRRSFINPAKAHGLKACVDFRLRGGNAFFLVIKDGTVSIEEPSPTRKVDWHISADPVALLLRTYGRVGRWSPILKGRLLAWGRRPALAARIDGLFKTP